MSKPNASFMKNRVRVLKALVKNGCYLFPIKKYRKQPKGMWTQVSTQDWNTIQGWLDSKYNIGIDTGKSNLLVLDLDPKEEPVEDLKSMLEMLFTDIPNTFTVKTAKGGLHFYFKAPTEQVLGNTVSALLKHVDTRGNGGYVVAPGSVIIHPDEVINFMVKKTFITQEGNEIEYDDVDTVKAHKENKDWLYYERLTESTKFAELPEAFFEALTKVAESPTKGVACEIDAEDVDTEAAITRAIDYCTYQHKPSVEGQGGDNTTYQLFTRLRDMGITEDTAVELLYEHYNERCEPPWDYEDLVRIASHAYVYAKEPLGIMSAHADFKHDDEEAYDPEILQIVIPETGEVFQPVVNKERAALPLADKAKLKKEDKKQEKVKKADRIIARLNLAFSDAASRVRYVYVAAEDEVYNRLTRQVLKPGAFARAKRQDYIRYMDDMKVTPFEAAEDLGDLVHAESFEYIPGDPIFTKHPKDPQAIVWNTFIASEVTPMPGDTHHFDKYMDTLFFHPEDKVVALNYLAHRVQNPDKIHSFCLIIRGNHGSGKTLFAQLLGALVGEENYSVVKATDLKSQFNGWAMNKQVILLDECFDLGTLEIANALKTLVGAKEISINRKNKNQIKVKNHADYIVTSNYEDALRMDKGERRYYVIEANPAIKTNAPETLALLDPIHAMVQGRNPEAKAELQSVLHKLLNMDLSSYNPNVLPSRTEAMEDMIKANRADWQSFLIESIENKENGFMFDAYAISDIATLLKQNNFNKGLKLSSISGFLRENGFEFYKDCRTIDFRKDIMIVRNQLLWESVGEYGIKKALAEYVKTHSHSATEYATEDEVIATEKFLKDFSIRDNVTPIKK